MERVQLLLRWKRALRVILPFALSVDMLHNIYYVTSLYKTRCDEWQQEDFQKTRAAILASFHKVITRCEQLDADLWPKAVSGGFDSAIVPVACPAPSIPGSGRRTALAVLAYHDDRDEHTKAYDDVEEVVFGQLCCEGWRNHAYTSCQTPNEAEKGNTSFAPDAMQQPCASVQSARSAKTTMLSNWYIQLQQHVFGRGNHAQLKEDLLAEPESALDPVPTNNTAEAAHLSAKAVTSATPVLHWHENSHKQQDTAQSMQQGTMNRARQADEWAQCAPQQYVHQQGYPWPCMQIARRSALRWHVTWHGFVWPQKQELLVNLDCHY